MEIDVLLSQNPWWKGKGYIEKDEDYRKWKESKIKWIPPFLSAINLKPFSLHLIFGPRQVGKTTALKLLIKKSLDSDIKPESIFYFKCDKLSDYKELDEVLKAYFAFRREREIKKSFIFLDEITYPREWFRTIKYYIDMGNFKNDVLILTGSLSMTVTGEIETFPGRRGSGKDVIALPLSFREFVKTSAPEIYKKLTRFSGLNKDELIKKSAKVLPYLKELNELFDNYLKCGGFPLALKSFLAEGKVSDSAKEAYLSWFRGDMLKLKRNPETVKRILKALIEKAPSAVSWNGIAKDFELKSQRTVYQYINLLSDLFVIKVFYFIDPNTLRVDFDKNKKVHLIDPFYFHLFSDWCLTGLPKESIMVESIVASHLARKYDAYFWKNKTEIDAIVREKDSIRGFEVKWKEKLKTSKIFVGKLKETTVLTKSYFVSESPTLPVSIFLACLDV